MSTESASDRARRRAKILARVERDCARLRGDFHDDDDGSLDTAIGDLLGVLETAELRPVVDEVTP